MSAWRARRREDESFVCSVILMLAAIAVSKIGVAELFAPLGLIYFLVNLVLAYRLAQLDPFDPLAWFLLASGVSFGLGVLPVFVLPPSPGDFIQDIESAFPAISASITISYVAGALVVGTVAVINRYWGYPAGTTREQYGFGEILERADRFWWVFAGAAAAAALLALAYFAVGFGSGFAARLSGIVFAIFGLVFSYNIGRAGPARLIIGTGLIVAAVILGFLDLYKLSVLLPLLGVTAGIMLRKGPSIPSYLAAAALAAAYLLVIQPVVTEARTARTYALQGMTLVDRVAALDHGMSALGRTDGGLTQIFVRTSMLNFQAFAVDLYDSGRKIDTMSEWYWGFAPRLLFPDKPAISRFGSEYYMIYSGSPTPSSSLPMTYMIEAYANGGFALMVAVSILFGAQIAALRHLIQAALRRRSMLVIAVAPAAAFYATGVETPFILHTISQFVIVLSLLLLVNLIAWLNTGRWFSRGQVTRTAR